MTLRSGGLVSVEPSDNTYVGEWMHLVRGILSFEGVFVELKEECNFDYDEYDLHLSLDHNSCSNPLDIGDVVAMSSILSTLVFELDETQTLWITSV